MPWTQVPQQVIDSANRHLYDGEREIHAANTMLLDAVADGGTADDIEFEIRDLCSRLSVAQELINAARRWLPSEERAR